MDSFDCCARDDVYTIKMGCYKRHYVFVLISVKQAVERPYIHLTKERNNVPELSNHG